MSGLNELNTGYTSTLFSNFDLRQAAKRVAEVLKRIKQVEGDFHVAVTGKSGIAMAFAVAMIHEISIVTIRKTGETSHGGKIEGKGVLRQFVVLDDFVDSGATVRRINEDINNFVRSRGGEPVRCLGFIEYTRMGPFWPGALPLGDGQVLKKLL